MNTNTTVKAAIVQPVRVILYLRLSDFRKEDPDSFPEREAKLRALATSLGWEVVQVVIENDVTPDGKRRNASAFKRKKIKQPDGTVTSRVVRKGWDAILADFRAGKANALLAEDLDRTMRDPRDLEEFIDLAEELKINARSLSGSLTFTDGGTDSEITMARIMVTIANKSSRDTGRRVSGAKERQSDDGRFGGGKRPYGFEPGGPGQPMKIKDDEAKVIANCARRFMQGVSLRALVAELRERGVPTATGSVWNWKTLRQILLAPRVTGLLSDGETVAPWEPIVPREVWDAIGRKLQDPSRVSPGGKQPKWLGSGVYRCDKCGGWMEGNQGRYRCRQYEHLSRQADLCDLLVKGYVVERLGDPELAVMLAPQQNEVDVAGLRQEALAIRANLDGMAEDRALGLIDRSQMIKATQAGNRRIQEINQTLASVVQHESAALEMINTDDPGEAFLSAPLATQQAVIRELFTVTIVAAQRGRPRKGFGLDASAVRVKPVQSEPAHVA